MFAETTWQGRRFNKLVVFDEAHKYIGSPDLVAGLVEVVLEMRHKGTSILVASQDPPSVPASLIELSTQIIRTDASTGERSHSLRSSRNRFRAPGFLPNGLRGAFG